ncbi:hypothetical protein [Luteimonas sp. SDU101]|uniref:hypothetical protein n=1 Tax=unclassified Luteimonas TaxID=2629088 RepID=UPI003EC0DC13
MDQNAAGASAGHTDTRVDLLRDELDLCRRELADARLRQEAVEERLAVLEGVEAERVRLADLLARHLSHTRVDVLAVGGWRGRLARRLLAPMLRRTGDGDPQVAMIEESGYFDAAWYVASYPDVAEAGERPAVHYLYHGGREGRAAGPRFDSAFYLTRYPDVVQSDLNPLVHFLQHGRAEGRLTTQPVYARPASGVPDGVRATR